jgi:hypothetical protein
VGCRGACRRWSSATARRRRAGAGCAARRRRLAAPGRVAATAPTDAGAARGRRADRLHAGEPGQPELGREKGGAATGPNPTDKGKPGSKPHLLVDRESVPLAPAVTAANVHDSRMLKPLLDAVLPVRTGRAGRPRCRPAKLHADKGAPSTGLRLRPVPRSVRAARHPAPHYTEKGSRRTTVSGSTAGRWSAPARGWRATGARPSGTSAWCRCTRPSCTSPVPSSAGTTCSGCETTRKYITAETAEFWCSSQRPEQARSREPAPG